MEEEVVEATEEVVELVQETSLGNVVEEQEQPKYLLNVGHWVLGQDPETHQTTVEPKITQLFYKTKKEADDKMKQLELGKFFKSPTVVGSVVFGLISLELVNIDKYVKFMQEKAEAEAQQKEKENGTGSGVETESGEST